MSVFIGLDGTKEELGLEAMYGHFMGPTSKK